MCMPVNYLGGTGRDSFLSSETFPIFFYKIYHCFAFILLLRDGFSCKIHHCFCFHSLAEG